MPTYTALTTLSGKEAAEKLGAALERLDPEPTGIGVFEVEDGSGLWEVGGYFTDAPDETALALVAAAMDAKPFAISELPEVDWVSHVRRELQPVVAGPFFVYGAHDADKVPANSMHLMIEAAMAFGTGHHGTTLGCLRALDRLVGEGVRAQRPVDIGCGTAVLAMAAARVWQTEVLASDVDPVAVKVALANVVANGLIGRVQCVEGAGFDAPMLMAGAPYDLVFANILKAPLIDLAPDVAHFSVSGAHAILSGILNEQADEVSEVYCENGYSKLHEDVIGEWTTLTLTKTA